MPDATPRVAVVDDNDATLYSTSRVLRAAGFEVVEGTSGGEALDLARGDVDIMLLDVNLPDLHGFEVCRRLRGQPQSARLPIIHVSATFVTDLDFDTERFGAQTAEQCHELADIVRNRSFRIRAKLNKTLQGRSVDHVEPEVLGFFTRSLEGFEGDGAAVELDVDRLAGLGGT